jgi:hypothetical protein
MDSTYENAGQGNVKQVHCRANSVGEPTDDRCVYRGGRCSNWLRQEGSRGAQAGRSTTRLEEGCCEGRTPTTDQTQADPQLDDRWSCGCGSRGSRVHLGRERPHWDHFAERLGSPRDRRHHSTAQHSKNASSSASSMAAQRWSPSSRPGAKRATANSLGSAACPKRCPIKSISWVSPRLKPAIRYPCLNATGLIGERLDVMSVGRICLDSLRRSERAVRCR